ncbi:MAG: DUF488 domain-containing protein [Stomatobaculum sp.]
MHAIKVVRVYDLTDDTEGYRILVDRMWPRGLRKEALRLDVWAKDISPSKELRQWFGHVKERFDAFEDAYRTELSGNSKAESFVSVIRKKLKDRDVLLLYAARDFDCNHAIILREWLKERISEANR